MKNAPGIELVKWAGFAAMIYDHADLWAGLTLPFADDVGAAAFPFFAVALAYAMRGQPGGKVSAVVRLMLLWGVGAQLAVLFVRELLPLNVLFTLAFGLAIHEIASEKSPRAYLAIAVTLIFGCLAEFSVFGVALVFFACRYVDGKSIWPLALSAIPLYIFNAGSFMAVPAVLAAVWLVERGPEIPRIRRVFYPLYVVQYPLLRLFG